MVVANVNEEQEHIAMMNMFAKVRRNSQIREAVSAANIMRYRGELTTPPKDIGVPRWRAMVNSILNRGLPT